MHTAFPPFGDVIARKNTTKFLIGLLVSIGCLYVAVRDVEWQSVVDSFKRADYTSLPVMLLLVVVFYVVKAWRWTLFLRPIRRFTMWEVTPAMMIGFMGNNILPMRVGELIRGLVLGHQYQIARTPILTTIVLERVFDLTSILALFGISLLVVENIPDELATYARAFAVLSAIAVAGILVFIFFTDFCVKIVDAILARLPLVPAGLRNKVGDLMHSASDGLSSVRDIRLLTGILVLSFFQWVINGQLVYVAIRSFGHDVSPSTAIVVMTFVAFGVAAPSVPGFFGVLQACFTKSLVPFGVNQADAFAASVFYHMCQYIPVTLGGLWFLNRVGLRLSELRQSAGDESPSESAEPVP